MSEIKDHGLVIVQEIEDYEFIYNKNHKDFSVFKDGYQCGIEDIDESYLTDWYEFENQVNKKIRGQ